MKAGIIHVFLFKNFAGTINFGPYMERNYLKTDVCNVSLNHHELMKAEPSQ